MCSFKLDNHDDTREEELKEVRTILKRRREARVHWGYWLAAVGSTAIAILAWGLLLAYGITDDASHMTRHDGTIMTFFVVLGGVAIGSNVALALVRNQQRLAAELDRIDDYRDERIAGLVRDSLGVFLREGDASAQQAMERTQQIIDSAGGGNVRSMRSRG